MDIKYLAPLEQKRRGGDAVSESGGSVDDKRNA